MLLPVGVPPRKGNVEGETTVCLCLPGLLAPVASFLFLLLPPASQPSQNLSSGCLSSRQMPDRSSLILDPLFFRTYLRLFPSCRQNPSPLPTIPAFSPFLQPQHHSPTQSRSLHPDQHQTITTNSQSIPSHYPSSSLSRSCSWPSKTKTTVPETTASGTVTP